MYLNILFEREWSRMTHCPRDIPVDRECREKSLTPALYRLWYNAAQYKSGEIESSVGGAARGLEDIAAGIAPGRPGLRSGVLRVWQMSAHARAHAAPVFCRRSARSHSRTAFGARVAEAHAGRVARPILKSMGVQAARQTTPMSPAGVCRQIAQRLAHAAGLEN